MARFFHKFRPGGAAALCGASVLAVSAAGAQPGGGASAAAELRVRVVEGRTALYASTNAVREAVCRLGAGTELAVRGDLPDESVWVAVEPPEPVSVWIYRDLVGPGGAVRADRSRLRSGAGLNFSVIGSLGKGDRVEVRGRYGDWLRIRPPQGMAFWVLRDQVEPLAVMPPEGPAAAEASVPEAGGALSNRAAEAAGCVATNPAVPPQSLPEVAPPPELAGAVLAQAPGQGARAELTGLLDWGSVGGFAAPFCLVERLGDGGSAPVCHLVVSAELAASCVGLRVTVEGTRWQVKNAVLPVLVVRSIRTLE